jgi:hypothetical protein
MRIGMIVAALIAIAFPSSDLWADPFSDLTKTGSDACFRRDYDSAHLRKNPRQQTTAMVVWIRAGSKTGANVGLAAVRRGDSRALFISAACDWEEYRPGTKSRMESYKKRAGAGCITLAVPDVFEASSAEEGGGVILDPTPDGKVLMVHFDDQQTMVRRADRRRKMSVKFGADDRAFLLRRTDVKDCDFVKDAVTTPEPGVRVR